MPMRGNLIPKEWEKTQVFSDQPLPVWGTAEGVDTSAIQTGASTVSTAEAGLQKVEGISIKDDKIPIMYCQSSCVKNKFKRYSEFNKGTKMGKCRIDTPWQVCKDNSSHTKVGHAE